MADPLRIEVHLFAAAAQMAQCRAAFVEVNEGAQLAQVASQLGEMYPTLKGLLAISRWAVDHQFASLDTLVTDQQEIALIPPISGG